MEKLLDFICKSVYEKLKDFPHLTNVDVAMMLLVEVRQNEEVFAEFNKGNVELWSGNEFFSPSLFYKKTVE